MKTIMRKAFILTLAFMIALVPLTSFANSLTKKIDLSKSTQTVFVGEKAVGLDANTSVQWTNSIWPLADKVRVVAPANSIYGPVSATITIVSKNGKTYKRSASIPTGKKLLLEVKGAFGYNTKSVKVVVKGKNGLDNKTTTWTVTN